MAQNWSSPWPLPGAAWYVRSPTRRAELRHALGPAVTEGLATLAAHASPGRLWSTTPLALALPAPSLLRGPGGADVGDDSKPGRVRGGDTPAVASFRSPIALASSVHEPILLAVPHGGRARQHLHGAGDPQREEVASRRVDVELFVEWQGVSASRPWMAAAASM